MAGASTIQRIPQGLLSLFGLAAAQGVNLTQLAQELRCIADVGDMFVIDRAQDFYSGAQVVNAAQQLWPVPPTTNFVVPNGELWCPLSFGGIMGGGAGVTSSGSTVSILRRTTTSGLEVQPLHDTPQSTIANQNISFGVRWRLGDVFMQAGDAIGVWIGTLAGGNLSARFQLRVVRLTI